MVKLTSCDIYLATYKLTNNSLATDAYTNNYLTNYMVTNLYLSEHAFTNNHLGKYVLVALIVNYHVVTAGPAPPLVVLIHVRG